ncbi:hypothetical protein ACFL31_03995 [Candidatus Margulisiibacteriota bacterium]
MIKKGFVLMLSLVLIGSVAFGAVTVYLDGKVISKKGKVIGGSVYAPVTDIAKGLSLSAKYDKKTQALKLSKQASGMQLSAAEGNMGEWLTGDILRLKLDSIDYSEKSGKPMAEASLTVKNASQKRIFVIFESADLADESGVTFHNLGYAGSFKLQPGAAKKTKVKFRCDEGFTPAKMLFEFSISSKRDTFRVWLPEYMRQPLESSTPVKKKKSSSSSSDSSTSGQSEGEEGFIEKSVRKEVEHEAGKKIKELIKF